MSRTKASQCFVHRQIDQLNYSKFCVCFVENTPFFPGHFDSFQIARSHIVFCLQPSANDDDEPASKARREGDAPHNTIPVQGSDVIEIADEENGSPQTSESHSDIKSEPPDFTHTMPADSTQEPDSKYSLDNETSRNLTNYLDNLMSAHGSGGGDKTSQAAGAPSSPAAAAGSSVLSHLAHLAPPKSEPPSWEQQQQFASGSSPDQPQQVGKILFIDL